MIDPIELAGHLAQSATLLGNHLAGPVKAMLYCIDKPSLSVTLQFNPATLRIDRGLSVTPGEGDVYAGFKPSGGANDTLIMEFWLDKSEATGAEAVITALLPYTFNELGTARTIEPEMKKLYALTMPGESNSDFTTAPRPPVVVFLWNDLRFTGVITSMSFNIKHFDVLGAPVRASVDVTMGGRAFWTSNDAQKTIEPEVSPASFSKSGAMAELTYKGKTGVRSAALRVLNRLR